MHAQVLIVDDQPNVRSTVGYLLEKEGFKTAKAASGDEALKLLEDRVFDVALLDMRMAQMDGLELLRRIRARWPGVAVVLMTAYASIPSAVDAMKLGAAHYLEKPFTKETLLGALERVLAESGRGKSSTEPSSPFAPLIGSTPEYTDAVELARRAAASDKPVLLVGEVGTGKEQFARAIHGTSGRATGPFVVLRCAGAGPHVTAELFGGGDLAGKLVEANGGTLYLDEIGELPADAQSRLLRFLQDGEVVRDAGAAIGTADARVIAGTSGDLDEDVKAQRFRNDLYLRQRSILIRIPPLRERRGDLAKLVQQFARRHKTRGGQTTKFGKDAMKLLAIHQFPGNLQELEDIVEQAVALAGDGEVSAEMLERLGLRGDEHEPEDGAIRGRIEGEEKRAIEEALRRNPRNLAQAASELGISRTTLWRKMRKYELDSR